MSMNIWTKLTRVQKVITAIVASIATLVAGATYIYQGYDHFATKAYADEGDLKNEQSLSVAAQEAAEARQKTTEELEAHIQQQVVSSNRAEIWRAKREIKRLEREKAKGGQNPTDTMLINADIAEYKDLIECIRDGKELCY